ncbi:MAG: zf-HC2 domain-containing protein [Candidatus Omnitrophota bacterium]
MACYIDGLLLDDKARQLERHLIGCDRCLLVKKGRASA